MTPNADKAMFPNTVDVQFIFATRDIKKDEEIFIDYFTTFDGNDEK